MIHTLKWLSACLTVPAILLVLNGCKPYYFRNNYQTANRLLQDSAAFAAKPFLKAHLKNGEVLILKDTWSVDTAKGLVTGTGSRFDFNRNRISYGPQTLRLDSVAIFETNQKLQNTESGRIAALAILAGVDVAFGIVCITNPKACYGSCPTFYVNESDNFHYADAEGFSNAIAPSMEYGDIDALNNPEIKDHAFSIVMKNEALETHCVKQVKLLAYPRNNGERVYHSVSDRFYLCENNYPLNHAMAPEGDVTTLLKSDDRKEWFSTADGNNLSSKEVIYLQFDSVSKPDDLGLVLHFRQSLMTTYFIYSAIGYMGDNVSDFFAVLERNKNISDKLSGGIKKELGEINVFSWNETAGKWQYQGAFYETGPIAINRQMLALSNTGHNQNLKLKLVLNKGLWRMDYLALTNIKSQVTPIEIQPDEAYNKGKIDHAALASIADTGKYLISMPGSEYKFHFPLPAGNSDYELFLYSKGYYLEWMRSHWIKDKDLHKLNLLVNKPKKYLRQEAKNYKPYEAYMEQEFWNSRLDTKKITYDGN